MARKNHNRGAHQAQLEPILNQISALGDPWVPIFQNEVSFSSQHFEKAMSNLIHEPNINSTVILRADILLDSSNEQNNKVDVSKLEDLPDALNEEGDELLHRDLQDVKLRAIPLNNELRLEPKTNIVRRIIPRNPYKDHIINQTCLVLTDKNSLTVLIVYVPHIKDSEETPFYLPQVYAIGILYHQFNVSIHYLPFEYDNLTNQRRLQRLDPSDRNLRIALRLLHTSCKHSNGAKDGYEKRVTHDLVVPKIAFQNRYIMLKKKYAADLVSSWQESTDPTKHVFEDIAIAAFLIEFWLKHYGEDKTQFEFRDLGCGNGLLVYILIMEGYTGKGIDARKRKSWRIYPENVQQNLLEQIIIPSVLLRPHPVQLQMAPEMIDNGRLFQVPDPATPKNTIPLVSFYTAGNLLASSIVSTTEEFPSNTFIIGNHSDELTCWIPLFNLPFMVIPCCSHALNGAKVRYNPKKGGQNSGVSSTYGSLVDHVHDLAAMMNWNVDKEMLRIPSTRNAAIIGVTKVSEEDDDITQKRIYDILAMEGGAEGWVENSMALMKRPPRAH